jgi:membrane-bound serine protease (ClpP class)
VPTCPGRRHLPAARADFLLPINLAGLMLIVWHGDVVGELFVTSYGVLGIGVVIAFVIGALFMIDTSQTNLSVNRSIIAGAAVGFSAIVLGIGYLVLRGRRGHVSTGGEGLIGMIGEVRAAIAPGVAGQLFVHGEIWRAVSDEAIAVGDHARIMAVHGLEITVRSAAAAVQSR